MNFQRSCAMFSTVRQHGGYQCPVTRPSSPIPFCFMNCGEVALVAVVRLSLTGTPAKFYLFGISKITCVNVPILSCLVLHPKQMVAFPVV